MPGILVVRGGIIAGAARRSAAQTGGLVYGWDWTGTALPPDLPANIKPGRDGGAGVPPGANLQTVSSLTTSGSNQIIREKHVTGQTYIRPGDTGTRFIACQFDGKFLFNERFRADGCLWQPTVNVGQCIYWDNTLSSSPTNRTKGYTLRRCELMGGIDCMKGVGNVDIQDCYTHDYRYDTDTTQSSGDTHNDGMQGQGGSYWRFVHNQMDAWSYSPNLYGESPGAHTGDTSRDWSGGPKTTGGTYHGKSTSCILLQETYSQIDHVFIDSNWFHGLYVAAVHLDGLHGSDLVVTNNLVGNEGKSSSSGAQLWLSDTSLAGAVRTGNRWDGLLSSPSGVAA